MKSHARTIRIGDSDAKNFEAMLHAEKVLYAKIDMRDDNCKMFMYMDKDEEKSTESQPPCTHAAARLQSWLPTCLSAHFSRRRL